MNTHALIQKIDAVLPQTQCTRCGYDACLPYAQAIAMDNEAINRCPPGGEAGIQALAALTQQPIRTLDPDCGVYSAPTVALIDETHCIGCTLCIQACPVDAIVGANKKMHTVLSDRCTGCDLCLAPCPVDCITMVPGPQEWTRHLANQARDHFNQRQERLAERHGETLGVAARVLANKPKVSTQADSNTHRSATIADVLAKARARRQSI